ncbi:MAG: hypothetical protein KF740_07170 [Ramlibacter sp.]|nr:hypothetical protein [Ramlibacter sp.]
MQRRSMLKLGAASAVLLALAGGAVSQWQPGLRQGRLSAAGREVLEAMGRGILDGTLPADPTARAAALGGLLDRIDLLVSALPTHAQAELSQLVGVLATGAGRLGLAGLAKPWPAAGEAEIQQALQSMRVSRLTLKQQAYQALHDIVGGAYFSDASTWTLLGYPGPLKV